MLWLKALWNCVRRGVRDLAISIAVIVIILFVSGVVLCVLALIVNGILTLMGPDLCRAIGEWFDKHIAWIFGGLILAAAAIPAWDSLVIEKRRLERKALDER